MFQLTSEEHSALRSQFVTSSGKTGRRTPPWAFTEHGAVMAATVLNSDLAVEASIMVVRAFIRAREIIAEHADLKRRLDNLERRIAKKFSEHEEELQEIRFLIHQLEQPAEVKRVPIRFRPKKGGLPAASESLGVVSDIFRSRVSVYRANLSGPSGR